MTAFSSLNTALTALRYQQGVIDVSSTNVANASTEGYVRRRLVGHTIATESTGAVWSRSSGLGSGVAADGVTRIVDPLLDARVRREHATQSYLDLKAGGMSRLETGIAEPGKSGLAAALDGFKASLQDLVNSPGSDAARSQVLSSAAIVADAFNLQSANFAAEAGDQRARVQVNLQQVNDLAAQLASTNRTIAAATANGSDASTLLDARDQLSLQLSQLTGATATRRADGGMDVTLNGEKLVDGSHAGSLAISGGIAADGSADGSAVGFTLTTPDGTSAEIAGAAIGGEIGAGVNLLDVVIPDYVAGLNKIAADFADAMNQVHGQGYDAAGNPGGDFFSYDPADAAASLTLALSATSQVAASSLSGGVLDATNADAMADAITVGDAYQRLVNNFGSAVNTVNQLAANQQVMTTQVDNAREQLTGVSLDEETVNMLMAQKSYEAAARVMTTVDEMLDTLINRTGRVGL